VIEQFLNSTSTHYRLFSAVGGNIDDGSGLKGECLTHSSIFTAASRVVDGLFSDTGTEEENTSWSEDAVCEGQRSRVE